MRTTLYTFLLAMVLVLAPVTISWAGTDDSGLQVFELNGTNLGGMQPVTITEDTGIADTLINLIPSKQGYYSLLDFGAISSAYANITGVLRKIYVDQYYNFTVCQTSPTTGTHEVAVINGSGKTVIIPDSGGYFHLFFDGVKYFLFDNYSANTIYTATSITGPYTAVYNPCWIVSDAVKFKNRLFIYGGNYLIYYSSATDWADFTVAANKGGVINIGTVVLKMVPTSYGLYVFGGDGIYLISGNDTPTSWRIDKISSRINVLTGFGICDFNNDVYFLSLTRTLYKASGSSVIPVTTMPRVFASSIPSFNNCGVVQGRYVIFTNLPGSVYYGVVYDLVEQCWFLTTEFSWLMANSDAYYVRQDGNYYSIKMMSNFAESSYGVYGKPVIYPWQWDSAWITLDGNSANMKEIDRIEFEFQGGTSSVGVSRVDSTYAMTTYYKTFIPSTNTRITNNVWYSPVGKTPTNKIKFTLVSSGTQTQNVNYIVKKIRIYYRNLGSYGTTRSGK